MLVNVFSVLPPLAGDRTVRRAHSVDSLDRNAMWQVALAGFTHFYHALAFSILHG